MPRTYKSKRRRIYKKYDEQYIEKALEEYNSTNQSLQDMAYKYKISKSVLYRHNNFVMKKQGGQVALDPEIEEYLIECINICSEWGYPLEIIDLRLLIEGHLDNLGLELRRFKNNMPGPDYIKYFLERHKTKISTRFYQNIELSRVILCSEVVEAYFKELEGLLKGIPLSNIVNYDETHISVDPGTNKVIEKRRVKYPERMMNHTDGSISIMMAAAANGILLPPYVVYKAQYVHDTWQQNGPDGCCYNCTNSGWFDVLTFEDWVRTIAFNYFEDKSGTKILIGDHLATHLSIEIIKECESRNIRFIFLPANSTHLTQPLEVAFFDPLKIAWKNILSDWKKSDGKVQVTIPENIFPSLLKKMMEVTDCSTHSNITAGFEKCGISPINKYEVLSILPSSPPKLEIRQRKVTIKKARNKSLGKKTKKKVSGISKDKADITYLNVPTVRKKSKPDPIFRKPFAQPPNNGIHLIDYDVEHSDCDMVLKTECFEVETNNFPIAFDNCFTVTQEVELSSFKSEKN